MPLDNTYKNRHALRTCGLDWQMLYCFTRLIYINNFFKVLGWLNPTVTVKNEVGAKVRAVAIAQSVVDSFPDVSHAVCTMHINITHCILKYEVN